MPSELKQQNKPISSPALDDAEDRADPRHQKTYYLRVTPLRTLVTAILRQIFKLITISEVKGIENLPSSGPVIVAANHLTNFDVFPLQFALPRPIFYMGKEELFRNSFMDWFLRQLGAFPVYRGAQDAWAIDHAEKVLRHSLVLGIFPEGSRSKGRGLRPAKTGAARLAHSMHCPIVPIAIHGTQYIFRKFPQRAKIYITVGSPLHPQPGETHLALTDRTMFAMAEMLPPEGRGVYAYHPSGF
jgi:1-acyl-sn-glycerol-3-phosphate acyltransferase